MSSWGEAHQDLLNQFGVGNPIFRSGAAARGVNNHWRSSYPSYGEGAFSQERPWLLYRDIGSGEIRLYDVVRERIHNRMVGALEGASILGSNLGWVVMVEGFEVDIRPYRHTAHQHHSLFLSNPFTSEQYQLPDLTVNNLPCVLRYGVITGNPHQENLYACVIADNLVQGNRRTRGRHTPSYLEIYYIAKRNGQWDPYWSSTYFPEEMLQCVYVDSITPFPHMVSVRMREPYRCFDYIFETQAWTVSDIVEDDQMEWDPFQEFSFTQMKESLQIPPEIPTYLVINGTTTEHERVKNMRVGEDYHVLAMDGVWVEIRP